MAERVDVKGSTHTDTLVDVQMVGQQHALDTLRGLSSDLQQKGVRSALHVAARPLMIAMKSLAPNDNETPGSRLADSINKTIARPGRRVRTGGGDRVVKSVNEELALLVGPNKKYRGKYVGYIAWFTEKGTAPHDIKLKKAKIFHFGMNQDRGFVRKAVVKHPGTRALNWQSGAVTQSQGQITAEFYRGLDKWLKKQG